MIMDILLAIPIGIMYNMIVHKTGEIFNNDMSYKEKLQKNLLIVFGGGILGIILANLVFGENKKYKNNALRFGLYLGAGMLMCHSVMYNWKIMQNDTKFIVMIATLCMLIWYTYYRVSENKDRDNGNSDESILKSILPATYTSYERYNDDYFEDEQDDNDKIINY
jgi:low temperature requirement protein LtrA